MKLFRKNYKHTHTHKFSAWMIASKGLSGAFCGEIQIGSVQYKRCKYKSCQYIVAEVIL